MFASKPGAAVGMNVRQCTLGADSGRLEWNGYSGICSGSNGAGV